jgi:hypothetical protein
MSYRRVDKPDEGIQVDRFAGPYSDQRQDLSFRDFDASLAPLLQLKALGDVQVQPEISNKIGTVLEELVRIVRRNS